MRTGRLVASPFHVTRSSMPSSSATPMSPATPATFSDPSQSSKLTLTMQHPRNPGNFGTAQAPCLQNVTLNFIFSGWLVTLTQRYEIHSPKMTSTPSNQSTASPSTLPSLQLGPGFLGISHLPNLKPLKHSQSMTEPSSAPLKTFYSIPTPATRSTNCSFLCHPKIPGEPPGLKFHNTS